MTLRSLSLAMAIIALVLTPLLACCGATAAAEQPITTHDCGSAAPVADAEPDHAACDGCDDCAPTATLAAPEAADQAPPLAADASVWTGDTARSARLVRAWPPGRAPPRATPARLHDKLTV